MYEAIGLLSSVLFVLCLGGLTDQIKRIFKERRAGNTHATVALSLNQFLSSFFSFYGFFLYSFLLEEIDLFLFFTRFGACVLTAFIIYMIALERSKQTFYNSILGLLFSVVVASAAYYYRLDFAPVMKGVTQLMLVGLTCLLLQGGVHQITLIRQKASVGVLSFPMTLLFCLKDIANILFGIVIGIENGWPLILMGSVSGAVKATILYHFYWVKHRATIHVPAS
ncbi:MAG: hypothetical protein EAZ52_01035 [Alphaproteobacteria bacterium]|nr:MAG: hypothetical protein EAZ52_01035 [Alphaproteobacteria bacterium]